MCPNQEKPPPTATENRRSEQSQPTHHASPCERYSIYESVEAALGADDLLADLWTYVYRETFPDWSRAFMAHAARAVSIRQYAAHLVPGLLRTEDDARGRSERRSAAHQRRAVGGAGRRPAGTPGTTRPATVSDVAGRAIPNEGLTAQEENASRWLTRSLTRARAVTPEHRPPACQPPLPVPGPITAPSRLAALPWQTCDGCERAFGPPSRPAAGTVQRVTTRAPRTRASPATLSCERVEPLKVPRPGVRRGGFPDGPAR